jgi:hypothetical protein
VFLLYITQFSLQMVLGAWGLWYEGGARRLFKLDENRLP